MEIGLAGPGSGRRGVGDRLRQRVLRHLDQAGERGRVGHRKLGEHAPVHVNPGGLQALDEPVVGDAVRARGGVDALDPQPAERALAVLAARIGVRHRVEHLLLGLAVHPRSLAAVPARPLKHHPALLVGVDCPLHACHFLLPGGGLDYLASNFLIFFASAGASSTSPASRRVTLLGLCSNRCLRFARRRSTLPVPVSRKRLFAPLCVFIFGMLAVVFRLLRALWRGFVLRPHPAGSRRSRTLPSHRSPALPRACCPRHAQPGCRQWPTWEWPAYGALPGWPGLLSSGRWPSTRPPPWPGPTGPPGLASAVAAPPRLPGP